MPKMSEDSIEKETFPFVMTYLPDFVLKKAEVELNESAEKIKIGLQEIKVMAQAHKMTCDIDFVDDFLLQFLRQRKYDSSRAFNRLVSFISFKRSSSTSYLFRSIDIDKYFCYPSAKFFTFLPYRCRDGCAILLFEIDQWVPEELPIEDFKTLVATMFCQAMRDPMTQVNGYKLILDFQNITIKYLKYFTPQNVYLFYYTTLNCIPGRYKGIYLLNKSIVFQAAYTLIRGLIPEKHRKRILTSSSLDLLEYFPASVLPAKYGGVLTDYHVTEWLREANEQQGKSPMGGQPNYY